MKRRRDPIEAMPRRRNRRWEKQHGKDKAVYRGVNPNLALQVKTLAADLLVPVGEVARRLIEHALDCYARGDFDLHPRPHPRRLHKTLLPIGNDPGPSRTKRPEARWRVIITWRHFPQELKGELSALAGEEGLNVPIGELVSALLDFGLREYREERLQLTPACHELPLPQSREEAQ